ncbi:hypothetical protein DPSP01_014772 [Paraphaeosphaeria sporulosa]
MCGAITRDTNYGRFDHSSRLNQLLAYSADDGCTQGRPLVYMQCHGCSELTCFACTLYMDLSTASTGSSAALVVEARHDRVTQSGANELCSWLHQTYMNKRAMTQCMTAVQGPCKYQGTRGHSTAYY